MLAHQSAEFRPRWARNYMERLEGLLQHEEELLQSRKKVPSKWGIEWVEVPGISPELRDVWEAQKEISEAIEDLLGLEAPASKEVESTIPTGHKVCRVAVPRGASPTTFHITV